MPNVSKADLLRWFEKRMEDIGLSDLKEELYFPQTAGKIWINLSFWKNSCEIYLYLALRDSQYFYFKQMMLNR